MLELWNFLYYRGLPGARKCKLPFREWYGNLGELRSLVPQDVKMIVATASASKSTVTVIYESLKLANDTYVVTKSPDRTNLKYYVQYIDKDISLEGYQCSKNNHLLPNPEAVCNFIQSI